MSKNTFNKNEFYNTNRAFNRFNDVFVKYLLTKENHKKFLLDLINAVFDDCPPDCLKGKIIDLTLEDRELTVMHEKEKYGRLDIRALTNENQIIDIELQTYAQSDLGDRELFYFSKIFSSQPAQGFKYSQLKPVIIINILAINIFKRSRYHSCYTLNEKFDSELLSSKISFHLIEAQKCKNLNDKIDVLTGLKADDPTAKQQYCYCCKLRRVPAADLL